MRNKVNFIGSAERWSPTLALLGGALLLVAALGWLLGGSPEGPRFLPLVQIALVAGLVALLAALAVRPSLWMGWFGIRQVRYGTNTAIMVLAFLAIVGLVNYAAKQPRLSKQWDMTEQQDLTLSSTTANLINSLPEPVDVVGFYDPSQSGARDQAETILKRYQTINPDKFRYHFYDPSRDPAAQPLVASLGLTQSDLGSLFALMGDRHEKADGTDEKAISTAIYRLVHPARHTVYFVQGHGEYSSSQGLSQATDAIEKLGYIVKTTVITSTAVPTDTSALIVAAPLADFKQEEVDTISQYVAGGGALMVFVDPDVVIQAVQTKLNMPVKPFGGPLADYLRNTWGITVTNDMVLDNQYLQGTGPTMPAEFAYPGHQITMDLERRQLMTVLRNVRSLDLASPQPEGVSISPLLKSSDASASLIDPKTNTLGKRGPLVMAATAAHTLNDPSKPRGEARVLVFGSISLIDDGFPAFAEASLANRTVWIRSVNWAVGEDTSGPDIPDKTPTQRGFPSVTASTGYYVLFSSVCLIPGLVVLAGVVVFFQRRRQH